MDRLKIYYHPECTDTVPYIELTRHGHSICIHLDDGFISFSGEDGDRDCPNGCVVYCQEMTGYDLANAIKDVLFGEGDE